MGCGVLGIVIAIVGSIPYHAYCLSHDKVRIPEKKVEWVEKTF